MLDYEQIKEIINKIDGSSLRLFELEDKDVKLKLSKNSEGNNSVNNESNYESRIAREEVASTEAVAYSEPEVENKKVEEKEEVTIFAVNRNLKEDVVLNTDVRSFEDYRVAEHIVLESDDLKVVNAFGQENVKPKTTQQTTMDNGELTSMLHKASWNVIRLVKDEN